MAGAKNDDFDMKAEAHKFWDLLTDLHDNRPHDYQTFVTKQLEEGKQLFTPPEPCFCLKLAIEPKYNCSKLFLNVCKWIRVPKPSSDVAPVPVKGGVLRHKMDKVSKQKTNELIYDVAVSPDVLDECSGSQELEDMLIQLSFAYIEDNAEVRVANRKSYTKLKKKFIGPKEDIQYSIDENWKQYLPQEVQADFGDSILKEIGRMNMGTDSTDSATDQDLPSLKLHPDPTTHTSSDAPTPKKKLIEEISSASNSSYSESLNKKKVCVPKCSMCVREGEQRAVVAQVSLPGVGSVREIELDVAKESLSLVVKDRYELTVQLPAPVDEFSTKAKFRTRNCTLSVTIPCL